MQQVASQAHFQTPSRLTENVFDGVGVVEAVGVALDVKEAVIDFVVLGVGEADAVGDCVDVELAGMGTTAIPRYALKGAVDDTMGVAT